MPEQPTLTEAERTAVVEMMRMNFGTCMCLRTPLGTSMCDGHRFLSETDGRNDLPRVTRMLWIRRTVTEWQAQEWTGRCPECQREGIVISQSMGMCARCADTLPIPHFDPPALPW